MRNDQQVAFAAPKLTPVVKGLLLAIGLSFVLLALENRFLRTEVSVRDLLVLDPLFVLQGRRPWSVLTYVLVHDLASPFHVIFNCVALYFFGPALEERWGSKKFFGFAVAAALGGALIVLAAAALQISTAPVLGASAICLGAVVAWGLLNPEKQVFIYFFQARGIWLVYMSIAFALLDALTASQTSAAGHFGGILVGAGAASLSGGPLRRWYLQRKLRSLEAQKASLGGARPRPRSGVVLEVIPGGRDAKSKRDLN